jgi:hypothetical protein
MAWEHGGADFRSRFDKSTAQAEQMKEGRYAFCNGHPANEYRRHLDLGNHQRAALNSRGDRFSDADAVATREASFYRLGLAFSLRLYPGESSLGSPLAQIRDT